MTTSQDCQSVRGLLMLYLDSELDAAKTHSVNQHLMGCPACHRRFESEQLLESAIVRELDADEDMPDATWERISASIAPAQQGTPRARQTTRPEARETRRLDFPIAASLAAAAMLVAAIGYLLYDPGVKTERPSLALMPQLVALHRLPNTVSSRDPAGTARDLLVGLALPVELLPAAGLSPGDAVAGHAVRLLGAERIVVNGQPAVNLRYDCCGAPTSVFVIPRSIVLALPADMRPSMLDSGLVDDAIGGLLTHSLLARDAFVSVISEHSVVLADAWSG